MLESDLFDGAQAPYDTELIRRYHAGDQTAFHQLASRFFLKIKKQAAAYSDDKAQTEDLVQEGLIGLHDAVCSFDENGTAAFGTYAGVCIRNRMLSAIRHDRAAKNRLNNDAFPIEEINGLPGAPESDPQNALIAQEELQSLERFLQEQLSDTETAVLEKYLRGKSYDTIARELSISRKACDNAMQRVRQKLRQR